jgi:murein DD-endopeptidase MepM/ murein hydrolase activator NlpD
MARVIATAALCVALCFTSWIIGSLYPAPHALLSVLHAQAAADQLQADLSAVEAAGQAIRVEHQDQVDASEARVQPQITDAVASATPVPAAAAGPGGFDASLSLCQGMTIHNAPAADAKGRILNYAPRVNVNGVTLATDPTHGTCMSSGFGQRGAEFHKGLDYYDRNGGQIMAAADGVIREMKYRDDYGNMLLIDHGKGVYTRYAHLSAFSKGMAVGQQVRAGDVLGLMGNTAAYPIPVHLHFELLLGDYNNPKQSFGLTPHSPLEFGPA